MRFAVLAAVALAVGAAAAQDSQQRPTFRGGARFVRVDVYPTDSAGKPIEGLDPADFELFEDGKRQAIDTFDFVRIEPEPEIARVDPNSQQEGEALARDPRARVFAIVLDTRHVDIASGRALRQPLIDMLDRLIGPRDMFGVITPQLPASGFLLARRTTTPADMLARHWVWGAADQISPKDDIEQLLDSCFGSVTQAGPQSARDVTQDLWARYRERQTLDHLSALVDKLQSIREERKVVIVVTQGWRLFEPDADGARRVAESMPGAFPTVTRRGGRIQLGNPPQPVHSQDTSECVAQAHGLYGLNSQVRFRELMEKAARANVAFYPIDPRGLTPFDTPLSHGVRPPSEELKRLDNRADAMRTLAANTDGIALMNSNDLGKQFRILSDALSAYYLLGYYSTNTKFDGGYRRLEVKVKRPGVRVKARRRYFAPTEEEIASIAAGREAAARPMDPEESARALALGRLGELRHDRDLFLQAVVVSGELVLSAELGVNARSSSAWAEGGEVRFTITTAAGEVIETRRIAPLQSGVALRVPIASPGNVRVDARARAAAAGPLGAADGTLMLASPQPSLIGEVMSYRGISRALMPAADGRYRRTERATIEAPLLGGAVPTGARVLDKTGKPLSVPVTSRERSDAAGVRWMVVELVLAPLTDGDYVLELEVMKDAAREKKLFAIRVVR